MVVTIRKGLGLSLSSSHSPFPLWRTLKKKKNREEALIRKRRQTQVQRGKKDPARASKYITPGDAEGHERC